MIIVHDYHNNYYVYNVTSMHVCMYVCIMYVAVYSVYTACYFEVENENKKVFLKVFVRKANNCA